MNGLDENHQKACFSIPEFICESGQTLSNISVFYETWGVLNEKRDNAILIAHALTGTSHAAAGNADANKGWWDFFIGPGKAIDTQKYFVICANVLGGCSGTTGPSCVNEDTGERYGMSFPTVTIRDMVRCQKYLADRLKIKQLLSVTGGSMGGMQALEYAAQYPDSVRSIIPLATPGRAYPQSIAFRRAQRKAIMMDPDWKEGQYYGQSYPVSGIELARLIGVISYRSEQEFRDRFGRKHTDDDLYQVDSRFEVEKYLDYQGQKLAGWFDPNTYLYLSKSMDLHDLGYDCGSYEEGISRIKAKTLLIGFCTDALFPANQQRELADILSQTNNDTHYREIQTIYGHDGFLIEKDQISAHVRSFLKDL
ncbi:homoserine O-acetyltransferase [candidate division KSB1 bacterium]